MLISTRTTYYHSKIPRWFGMFAAIITIVTEQLTGRYISFVVMHQDNIYGIKSSARKRLATYSRACVIVLARTTQP